MKRLLLLAVVIVVPLAGEEGVSPSLREKMRARILETLPAPPASTVAEREESEVPVLVLEPVVVTESRGVKKLEKAIAEDRKRQAAEAFSPLKGGKIYSSDRLDIGGWWEPGKGWTFLKLKW
jgi:hypothetical protein